jgi:hypothetical protein
MALEVLYGPIGPLFNGTPPVAVTGGLAWIQGIGLLTVCDPVSSYGTYAMQMDGTLEGPRSSFNASGFGMVLDLRSARGLAVKGGSGVGAGLYHFNWLICQPDPVAFLLPGVTIAGANDIDVITPDGRYLQFRNDQVWSSIDGVTFVSEYAFAAPSGSTVNNVSRGRTATEVCIAFSGTNTLRFYDVSLKRQVGETLYIGESFSSCWCIPKWDVFLEHAGSGIGAIKILANNTAPATLSSPTALATVTAGNVSQLQVRLLGAQSEPCIGELINWSISAGVGSLTVPQSATDSHGYAVTGLVIPVGGAGNVTVGAELDF